MGRAPGRLAVALLAVLAGCATPPGPGARSEAPQPLPPPAGRTAAPRRYGPEPEVRLTPLEAQALDLARARLGGAGRRARTSGALVLAARELARGAGDGSPDPLARARVRTALARGGAYDAAPAAILVEAPRAGVLKALSDALGAPRATHVGAGAFESGGSVVLVVLASERLARLDGFPREVASGATAALSGTLAAGISRPRVFLTAPSGAAGEVATRAAPGGRFEATLAFPSAGAWSVEVAGVGAGGPEIAALFVVAAGGAPLEVRGETGAVAEPADDAAAADAIVRAVNGLRRRQGLKDVAAAPELAAVARRHSEVMAAQGRVAHVLPGSGEVGARLRSAGVAYRGAYENVASAGTALAAHESLEGSPAHRANLLRADATRIGVGLARVARKPEGQTVYLTEVLVAPPDDGAESPLTADARVREALWRERLRLGLPALSADPALDELARRAALAMHRRDAPEPGALGDDALALRRSVAAVDVFVASAPGEAIRSGNLRDRRFRRVGVGVTVGDSRRYGAGRLWIAVVYTD